MTWWGPSLLFLPFFDHPQGPEGPSSQQLRWMKELRVVEAAAPSAPWLQMHLPQHDLPQHPPSLSDCHVPPQYPTHLPNAAGSTSTEKCSTARRELSFHALLSENAIKAQALLTLSNSSLSGTRLFQRL